MNKKKFNLWMDSIDEMYLEEMIAPPKKLYLSVLPVAAACLLLIVAGVLFRNARLQDDGITREYFTRNNTEYTILSCLAAEPTDISGIKAAEAEPLVWYAGGLEIKLCSTKDTVWASWYDYSTGTQWCLAGDTTSLALLTTAKEIVEDLGYNVAVAPESASDITYDAFRINDLAVAETTFLLDGVRYSYRMAATYEVTTPFADISGTGTNQTVHSTTEVGWCPAELYYTENGYGKIIWFDIVPGLLYSLSMETEASEEALLSLAHELFSPAQDEADW